MTGGTLLFWILAVAVAFGAIAVVLTQNVVRMAFWLIVSLGSTSGLFFLLNADFVAATQLLVYVGGTVVLLIFGVMLTASGPYNQLQMSPGGLIGIAATGAAVFFIVFTSMKSVGWDLSVLRQVAISPEHFEAIHASGADEESLALLKSSFHEAEVHGEKVFHLSEEAKLEGSESKQILTLLKAQGLAFAPSSETGGTIRPLGFGLLGARPDKDLNSPAGLQRLSDGFYVLKGPAHTEGHAEHHAKLSPGYLLPFEIVSVHLLVVLIGAAYLARAKRRVDAGL